RVEIETLQSPSKALVLGAFGAAPDGVTTLETKSAATAIAAKTPADFLIGSLRFCPCRVIALPAGPDRAAACCQTASRSCPYRSRSGTARSYSRDRMGRGS